MPKIDGIYDELRRIAKRPAAFEHYTSQELWNDPHISARMLEAHLDSSHDLASHRGDFINEGADWIASRFNLTQGSRVCDLGCGPGLWSARFAQAGASVTGIDLSERSIRYAREVAARCECDSRYLLQDYLAFSTDERFDLVTLIHGDFSVLSPLQCAKLLKLVRTVLANDGFVILDVSSIAAFNAARETRMAYDWRPQGGFMSAAPHHLFKSTFKYEGERLLVDRYTVIEESRVLDFFNWNQCYCAESLVLLFERNGLEIVETLADVAGNPLDEQSDRIAVIARKRM